MGLILNFVYITSEGNLPDISKAGSIAEFLEELHAKFGPIASFWFGKELTVSVASPELFKETSHLFDRPGSEHDILYNIVHSSNQSHDSHHNSRCAVCKSGASDW